MCNPLEAFTGPNSGAQAAAAKGANQRTQAAINYGMQQLNAIYGGGSYPIYAQASGGIVPGQQYYKKTPKGYVPYGGQTGGANLMRKGKLFSMTKSPQYAGYNNNFFNQRAQAYEDYALPQLGQQYQQTKNSLQYNLANRGLIGGSVQNQENNDLALSMGQQKQGIADQGLAQAQQLRSDVQNSKLQAISQLYQTASPAQAQSSALADAARFSAPNQFAPLANGFANLVNQYAMNQQVAGYQQIPQTGYIPYGGGSSSSLTGAIPQNSY